MKRKRCSRTRKLIFATSTEAEREVELAQERRAAGDFAHSPGKEGQVEQRSYPCFACGGHHMTAMDEPNPTMSGKPRQRGRR